MYRISNNFNNRDVRVSENVTVPANGSIIADIHINSRVCELIRSGAITVREFKRPSNSSKPTYSSQATSEETETAEKSSGRKKKMNS